MSRVAVSPRWAIPAAVLVIVGLGTGGWLLVRDGGGSRTDDLEAMQPDTVGRPPTVDWPKRLTCEREEPPICAPEEAGRSENTVYLKETINLEQESPGLLQLLRSFFDNAFERVIVCPPATAERPADCTDLTGFFHAPAEDTAYARVTDVPAESAIYVR
jgi:hypothetical protein